MEVDGREKSQRKQEANANAEKQAAKSAEYR